jgi:hypothetical protein
MSSIVDQPPPVASTYQPAWETVIEYVAKLPWRDSDATPDVIVLGQTMKTRDLLLADMRERDRVGRERYGVPLQAGNGRRHLVDAYQEKLDFIVYLQTWLDEHKIDAAQGFKALPKPEPMGARVIISLFNEGIYQAALLRDLIEHGQ